MGFTMDGRLATELYGPREGDLIRLGDTDVVVRVERDHTPPGEEGLMGAGRNVRDGMLVRPSRTRESALDLCVKGVVLIDPLLGIVKGDLGVKDGKVVGFGHAGNPDVQDGVDLVLDTNTAVLPAHGLIATPGAIDCHVHFLAGAIFEHYLALGYTTLIGGSAGLTFDVGANPRWVLERMFEALAQFPLNAAFLARASSAKAPLEHSAEAGISGYKIHEDLGAYPAVIDTTLRVAEQQGLQVMIHTDTINESVSLEDTMAAIDGRTIHAYHVEGAGGGHAPDLLEIVSYPNVLPSSTNPSNPFTASAVHEHMDMIMAAHLLKRSLPEDVAFAQSRVRPQTMAGEDALHDLGAISMMGSDSVGMGRAGESVRRTWQLAHMMKSRGAWDTSAGDDNERVLRYVAKHTVNPAIAHGIDRYVGSLAPGRYADLVLWNPAWFAVKPDIVIKDGFIAWANTGHGNGSTLFAEPMAMRQMFGAFGRAPASLGHLFVSPASLESSAVVRKGAGSRFLPVAPTRSVTKRDMVRNDACPRVEVDKDTFEVSIDGSTVDLEPARQLPLNRRYWLI